MSDVKEVLAAITKTTGLRDKINKQLGLTKVTGIAHPDDMYEFLYKKLDSDVVNHIILHGKCIDAGQKQLLEWGYIFIQTRHFDRLDSTNIRVMCQECGHLMDEKAAKQFEKDRTKRLAQAHADWEEEQLYKAEWEEEQILLGKM